MLSKGVFTLPKKNLFTLGATYNHRDSFKTITSKAKEELISQMRKIKNLEDLKVIEQKYGFEPTTLDRKPLIGQHPILPNLYIFNGMGSKAVLIAPLIAKELYLHITKKEKLEPTSNIDRFSKYFTNDHLEFSKKNK